MPKSKGAAPPAPPPAAPRAPAGPRIPDASMAKARAAFQNFSLSRSAGGAAGATNVVQTGQQVSSVQERAHANHLKTLDASGRKLRVALSDTDLKKFLPSFDGKNVSLDDLMTVIQTSMRGSEFYCAGHPTLVSLDVQARASQLIAAVTQSSNGQPAH